MKIMKKIGVGVLDFIEVVMPVVALVVTFVGFIANVVSRYVLNTPINACYELCLMGLVWCLLLSAPYAARKHTNVAFTLVYDHLPAPGQLALRLLGGAFLIFCFVVMLYPCFDWVTFMARKYSTVLKARMDFVYAPFVVFNVLVIGHLLYDFVTDIIIFVNAITGKVPLQKAATDTAVADADIEGGTGV